MNDTLDSAQHEVAAHARRHGHWIVPAARIGYAAKGLVYIVIGALAVKLAIGAGGGTTDSRGALGAIAGSAGGRILLGVMAAGLAAYALWAVLSAIVDSDRRGSDAKGIAIRIGMAGTGVAYGALGVQAARIVAGASRSSSGGDRSEDWTARALALPLGRAIVLAIAVGIIAYAGYQFWRGARKNLRKHLRLGGADEGVIKWVLRLARFGIIARGVVFLVIGWFLVQAARQARAEEAGGVAESLGLLATQPYGMAVLGTVAAGLIGFGVWQLANAKYREMEMD